MLDNVDWPATLTLWAAGATVVAAAVAIIAAIIAARNARTAKRSADAAEREAKASERSADASERQAKAAEESLDVMRAAIESDRDAEKPRLIMEEWDPSPRFFKVRNTGPSEARTVRMYLWPQSDANEHARMRQLASASIGLGEADACVDAFAADSIGPGQTCWQKLSPRGGQPEELHVFWQTPDGRETCHEMRVMPSDTRGPVPPATAEEREGLPPVDGVGGPPRTRKAFRDWRLGTGEASALGECGPGVDAE